MTVLIDTSVLIASTIAKDARHTEASAALRLTKNEIQVVVQPVLNEMFQIVAIRTHYAYAIERLENATQAFHVEHLTSADFSRMITIMQRYKSSEFDFADVAIMAVAERLIITRICTFDRRDFSVYRPSHCAYFELLP